MTTVIISNCYKCLVQQYYETCTCFFSALSCSCRFSFSSCSRMSSLSFCNHCSLALGNTGDKIDVDKRIHNCKTQRETHKTQRMQLCHTKPATALLKQQPSEMWLSPLNEIASWLGGGFNEPNSIATVINWRSIKKVVNFFFTRTEPEPRVEDCSD